MLQVSRVLESFQSSGKFNRARKDPLGRKALQMSGVRPKILPEQLGNDSHADAFWRTSLQVIDKQDNILFHICIIIEKSRDILMSVYCAFWKQM